MIMIVFPAVNKIISWWVLAKRTNQAKMERMNKAHAHIHKNIVLRPEQRKLTGQWDRLAVFAPLLYGLRTARLPRVSLLYCGGGNESGTIDIARHQVIHGALLLDGHRGAGTGRLVRVRRLLGYSFKGTRVGGQRQGLLPATRAASVSVPYTTIELDDGREFDRESSKIRTIFWYVEAFACTSRF